MVSCNINRFIISLNTIGATWESRVMCLISWRETNRNVQFYLKAVIMNNNYSFKVSASFQGKVSVSLFRPPVSHDVGVTDDYPFLFVKSGIHMQNDIFCFPVIIVLHQVYKKPKCFFKSCQHIHISTYIEFRQNVFQGYTF